MTQLMRWLVGVLVTLALAACGGGGGSAGTTSSGDGGTHSSTGKPKVTLSLADSTGAAISTHFVTSGSLTYAKAVVVDKSGAPVANRMVSFNSGSGLLAFQPESGQVLTDSTGVAKVQVQPKTYNTSGAESLTAIAMVEGTAVAAAMDIQTSAATVALSNLVVGQANLSAFQSTSVTVDVTVNGAPSTTYPVSVGFSSNCGSFSPTSAPAGSNGKAASTFNASGCPGGAVTLTASATGATPVQTNATVQIPTPTNILFVSATPSVIYTSVAAFGVKQSTVVFKVVDASGAPVTTSTTVQVSLSSSAIASGVVFADTNSTAARVVSSDANGQFSVIVKAGAFPTPLALTAQLVSNPAITASSAGLTVDSGRPTQAFFSMSASSMNIEGWRYDGESTNLQIYLADRLGQPVPESTPISFVSEGGQVTASCLTEIYANKKSGCAVSLISQQFRPTNGRVTVLAYAEGEEVFVDANGNNRYDAGETFHDMGQPFIDADEDGKLTAGEQKIGDPSIPGSGIGSGSCSTHPYQLANVNNTCDGKWGPIRVREQMVIAFSDSFAADTEFVMSGSRIDFLLADTNGNAMPADSVVAATVEAPTSTGTGTTGSCGLDQIIPSKVPSTPNPTFHTILLKGGACSGAMVTIKVTTPKNNQTLLGRPVIP